jgi:hypothetical protein
MHRLLLKGLILLRILRDHNFWLLDILISISLLVNHGQLLCLVLNELRLDLLDNDILLILIKL